MGWRRKTGRKPFTDGKLRLVRVSYRTVFGVLRPVLRYGRILLRPVTTPLYGYGAEPYSPVYADLEGNSIMRPGMARWSKCEQSYAKAVSGKQKRIMSLTRNWRLPAIDASLMLGSVHHSRSSSLAEQARYLLQQTV